MKVEILKDPDVKSLAEILERTIKRRTILISGNCWISYWGRAGSKLKPGERIVIIKKDGALLVHRPVGYEPVNWMPEGEIIYHIESEPQRSEDEQRSEGHINLEEPILSIRAVRLKPRETIKIFFDRVYLFAALNLVDEGEFSLYASEEDMQEAILANPSLIEPGFQPITYEKRVEPGFVDVFGIDRDGRFVVIEIKRRTAGREAVLQLSRYVSSLKGKVNRDVRGILAAPRIARGVQRLLVSLGLEFKSLDPKRCAEILNRKRARSLEEFY